MPDARFLNLWIVDHPFQLDRLSDLPRYVHRDSYQTILDDKSGYDHILLTPDSRTFFGIQWGGGGDGCSHIILYPLDGNCHPGFIIQPG